MLKRNEIKKLPEFLMIRPISVREADDVIFLHKTVADEHKYLKGTEAQRHRGTKAQRGRGTELELELESL